MLSDRLPQTMLHIGLGLYHRYRDVDRVADHLCPWSSMAWRRGILGDRHLDGSKAMQAVEEVMRSWDDEPCHRVRPVDVHPIGRPN